MDRTAEGIWGGRGCRHSDPGSSVMARTSPVASASTFPATTGHGRTTRNKRTSRRARWRVRRELRWHSGDLRLGWVAWSSGDTSATRLEEKRAREGALRRLAASLPCPEARQTARRVDEVVVGRVPRLRQLVSSRQRGLGHGGAVDCSALMGKRRGGSTDI